MQKFKDKENRVKLMKLLTSNGLNLNSCEKNGKQKSEYGYGSSKPAIFGIMDQEGLKDPKKKKKKAVKKTGGKKGQNSCVDEEDENKEPNLDLIELYLESVDPNSKRTYWGYSED